LPSLVRFRASRKPPSLVVIRDLYLVRPIPPPDEADSVLVIDSDAVLAGPCSLERFQTVSRVNTQFRQVERSFNLIQLAKCWCRYRLPAPMGSSFEELLRVGIFEAPDHAP